LENKIQKIGLVLSLMVVFFAFITKNKREVILTKAAPQPIGPYSQAIKTDHMVYVSGQIALTPDGKMDTTSIEAECKQVLENIKAIMEASGLKMDHVVKSTIYTTDLKKFNQINEVYKTYFTVNPPARETIQVVALPKGAHVEISVIAEK
jgi:2-iminobutanoate/2-iminopropanoate deaminase